MKTLIVEDDLTSRILLQKMLSPYGETNIAVDGEEAINAFQSAMDKKEPYDLICLDIMMPKKSGHEVLVKIRDLEREAGLQGSALVKIVMTSALEDSQNVRTAFKAECDTYLTKPIYKELLIEKLKDLGLME